MLRTIDDSLSSRCLASRTAGVVAERGLLWGDSAGPLSAHRLAALSPGIRFGSASFWAVTAQSTPGSPGRGGKLGARLPGGSQSCTGG
jgi:hypothetical protein